MDPNTGRIYPTVEAARAAGVNLPVELVGTPEAVQRISAAVKAEWTREQKAARNARNKRAAASRRQNRGR